MVPTPAEIVAMITAICTATTEVFKFLNSSAGQEAVKQGIADREKWDSFWGGVGKGIKDLFTGNLFKIKAEQG